MLGVRCLEDDEAAATLTKIWQRYRRTRVGELPVDLAECQFFIDLESKPAEGMSAALYLAHRDGFAAYRVTMNWNDGHPAHAMRVTQAERRHLAERPRHPYVLRYPCVSHGRSAGGGGWRQTLADRGRNRWCRVYVSVYEARPVGQPTVVARCWSTHDGSQ